MWVIEDCTCSSQLLSQRTYQYIKQILPDIMRIDLLSVAAQHCIELLSLYKRCSGGQEQKHRLGSVKQQVYNW